MHRISENYDLPFLAVEKRHSGDNAAMIAYASTFDSEALWSNDEHSLTFMPSLEIDQTPSNLELSS